MKKWDEETKKKKIKALLKVLLVVALLAISILFSKVNLAKMGHDFFLKVITIGMEDQEESADSQTEEPKKTEAPSTQPATQEPDETSEDKD